MKSCLDTPCSFVNNPFDTGNIQTASLLDCLLTVRYKKQVEAIRNAPDEASQKAKKDRHPMFYTAGTFDKIRDGQLQQPSGFLCLDIDRKDNAHLTDTEFKNHVNRLCHSNKTVAYCGLSVRGQGYFVLVRIADYTRYRDYYQLYKKAIRLNLNLNIDKSCSNINRGRYFSYDPKPYINDSAEVAGTLPSFGNSAGTTKTYEPSGGENQAKVEYLINRINLLRIDITGGNTDWFKIGCSLANAFGEQGREYFHQVSQYYTNGLHSYDASQTDKQYSHCIKHSYSYTIATFFHYCLQAGLTLPKSAPATIIVHKPEVTILAIDSDDDYPAFWDSSPTEKTGIKLIPQWPETMKVQLYKLAQNSAPP